MTLVIPAETTENVKAHAYAERPEHSKWEVWGFSYTP